jgi:GrpB-like predicted nucleotidyltransferase (UPF0157 family)
MVDGLSPGERRPTTEAEIRAATVGEPEELSAPIVLAEADPAWPLIFEREVERVRGALRERALRIEHVGSTSVPGLAAKPIIDMLLVVADSADEPAYLPALEGAGYVLRVREPDWKQHRMLRRPDAATKVNLHVFSSGCDEVERMLRFRDRLRTNRDDRERYLSIKRELAGRSWKYVQGYADAKSALVEEILHTSGAE